MWILAVKLHKDNNIYLLSRDLHRREWLIKHIKGGGYTCLAKKFTTWADAMAHGKSLTIDGIKSYQPVLVYRDEIQTIDDARIKIACELHESKLGLNAIKDESIICPVI